MLFTITFNTQIIVWKLNKLHTIISESKVSNREFSEMKKFLENGGILQNEAVPYHVLIRKYGQLVFMVG